MNGDRLDFRYDRWCAWLLNLLGMGPRFSSVVLSEDEIDVKMGWAFRASIPRSSVALTRAHSGRVLGWGVHGWRGRWLVNGSSQGLVTLDIEPAARASVCGVPIKLRRLTVSLVEPALLLETPSHSGAPPH